MKELERQLSIDKSNWVLVKFGNVVFEPKESAKDAIAEGIEHVVGLEHIDPENIHLNKSASIEESTTFSKKFSAGDVLFGRRRAYLKKAAQASFSGICSGDITVMRVNEALIPELLPFIVNNEKFFDYAVKHSAGGLSPRVKFKDLAKYEFLLPPKQKQAKLAELLWAMDKVIERRLFDLDKQKILFLSYSQSIFAEGEGVYTELKDLGKLIMGQSPLGSTYNDEGDGMPFLQGNAEFGKVSPSHVKFTTAPNKIVKKGTILISVRAPVGDLNIANMEYCIGRGLAGLYIEDSYLRDYVYNFLKFARSQFHKNSAGSTFKAINKNELSSIGLIIPSSYALADNSHKINAIIDLKEKIESSIESSKSLQKSLINQIF